MKALLLLIFVSSNSYATLIAHRGVHQNYDRSGLNNQTCTAQRIYNIGHEYIENTLKSIEEAFNNEADMVELDIHPTTEKNGVDELVVFHDWGLECRTEATCQNGCNCNKSNMCVTNEQSLRYLQTLDVGYGYTQDKGKTFPLRGKYRGKMPQLEDVLTLLERYPNKKILINVKGNTKRTAQAFLRIIKSYPLDVRKRLFYPYKYGFQKELQEAAVEQGIDQNDKKCLFSYLKTGWRGHFPKECHNQRIFIPVRETLERFLGKPGKYIKVTSVLWGWPSKFIALAHANGTRVYASQVDSIKEYNYLKKFKLDGMMTNKIELIGPQSIK